MTSNQIAAKEAAIKAADLAEKQRSNKTKERETERSNRVKERNERRGQNLRVISDGASLLGKINDPSWYNQNKQLVNDVANISFQTPVSSRRRLMNGSEQANPMVFRVDYTPVLPKQTVDSGLGPTTKISEGVMQGAYNMYAWIRQANSGGRNYEAVDLLQYCLAMQSLYSMIAFGMRGYRAAHTFDSYNRNYSQTVPYAVGIDATDWRSNLADIRAFINTAIQRASSFNVPTTMSYFLRSMWLQTNIFKDHDIKRSALISFCPNVYYVFKSGANALLSAEKFPSAALSVNAYKLIVNSMFSALDNDDDISIISGDIRKAYGDVLFHLNNLTEDETLTPVYSTEVLAQISGATMVGEVNLANRLHDLDLTQEDGGNRLQGNVLRITDINLPQANYANASATFMAGDSIAIKYGRLNFLTEDTSPDLVMVASRMITLVDVEIKPVDTSNPANGSVIYRRVHACGTEVVNRIYGIYIDDSDGSVKQVTLPTTVDISQIGSNEGNYNMPTNGFEDLLNSIGYASIFDWYPAYQKALLGITPENQLASVKVLTEIGDIAQYAYINSDVVTNMHNVACQAMFGVPYTGLKLRSNS